MYVFALADQRALTTLPFGLLKQGPKRGPAFRAFSRERKQMAGPDFFVTFSQNVHKIYARPEALMSIPNGAYPGALTQPKGGDLPRAGAGPI